MTYAPIPNEDIDVGSPLSTALVTQLRDTGEYARFGYNAVSGATQALDLEEGQFFDAGTLTADTTVSFSNVPTEARWAYSFKPGVDEGYVLSLASNVGAVDIDEDTDPAGVGFKTDGTKMYVSGQGNGNVYQYTLSTAWDITTATYDSVSFSTSGQDGAMQSIIFKPDGTKFYIMGFLNKRVYQYSMSTAWDLSTASYDSVSFLVSGQDSAPIGLFFKSDGTKMYVMGNTNAKVFQYTLSTAWSVSTASYDSSFLDVYSQTTQPYGIFITPDGTRLFVSSASTDDKIYQYTLSTAWSISTASYDSIVVTIGADPNQISFSDDGASMFVLRYTNDEVRQYSTATFTSLTLPSSVDNPPSGSFSNADRITFDFWTSDGGTTVNYGSAF